MKPLRYASLVMTALALACAASNKEVEIDDQALMAKSAAADDMPNPDDGEVVDGDKLSDSRTAPSPGIPQAADAIARRPSGNTEVLSIDSRGAVSGDGAPAETDGPKGGPDEDESDEPVLGDADPVFWLELPETPRLLMLGWPLPATGVTSAFGERADPIDGDTRFHYGLDLEAAYGQVVKSAAAGRVAHVGFNHGHGRQIVVTHAGGYQTGYSHLSQTMVYEGQMVEAGEALGLVGTSGRTTGPHLHFEVTRWGTHLDPMSVLGVAIKLR